MTWLPVVEPDLGQERFFTDEPNKLLRNGNFAKVNVMIGVTADEFISPVAGETSLLSLLRTNFEIAFQRFLTMPI